jgi:hypothetical protein
MPMFLVFFASTMESDAVEAYRRICTVRILQMANHVEFRNPCRRYVRHTKSIDSVNLVIT